jgi:hypothetical protein
MVPCNSLPDGCSNPVATMSSSPREAGATRRAAEESFSAYALCVARPIGLLLIPLTGSGGEAKPFEAD